jgi:hypothetical protein
MEPWTGAVSRDGQGTKCRGTGSMKSRYRSVEFAVQTLKESEWIWEVYPTGATTPDAPIKGKVRGTVADAIGACFSAIDEIHAHRG